MFYTLRFFSSKCSLFHNANLFGSCIIHILYTGCAKIKKKYFRRQRANRLVKVRNASKILVSETEDLGFDAGIFPPIFPSLTAVSKAGVLLALSALRRTVMK